MDTDYERLRRFVLEMEREISLEVMKILAEKRGLTEEEAKRLWGETKGRRLGKMEALPVTFIFETLLKAEGDPQEGESRHDQAGRCLRSAIELMGRGLLPEIA